MYLRFSLAKFRVSISPRTLNRSFSHLFLLLYLIRRMEVLIGRMSILCGVNGPYPITYCSYFSYWIFLEYDPIYLDFPPDGISPTILIHTLDSHFLSSPLLTSSTSLFLPPSPPTPSLPSLSIHLSNLSPSHSNPSLLLSCRWPKLWLGTVEF